MEEVIEMRTPVFTEPATSALLADIYETPCADAYVIEIPVPGLKPDEIVVEADTYSLTVSTEPAQTEPKSGRRYIQREFSVRPMSRIFNFPVEIDIDNVQATLENASCRSALPRRLRARGNSSGSGGRREKWIHDLQRHSQPGVGGRNC